MLEDPQVIVTRFVEGEGMSEDDLREPEFIRAVAAALRKVHDSGRELASTFDSSEIVERYAATARERASRHRTSTTRPTLARARSRGR